MNLVVTFGFLPKIVGGGRDQWKVIHHSMKTGSLVGIPWGSEDTSTLPYMHKNLCELSALTCGMDKKPLNVSAEPSHTPEPPGETFTNYFYLLFLRVTHFSTNDMFVLRWWHITVAQNVLYWNILSLLHLNNIIIRTQRHRFLHLHNLFNSYHYFNFPCVEIWP